MPLRNRVTPLGELVADPARGLVYGNRGCLHDDDGTIRRHSAGRRWIACRLEFRGRRRHPLVQPHRYTGLFFLDDATALAAGHRACAECRRPDYDRLLAVWGDLHTRQRGADGIDRQLHEERLVPGTRAQAHHEGDLAALPDGCFVLHDGGPHVVHGDRLLRWSVAGYAGQLSRPARSRVRVITPPSLVRVLAAGWEPAVPLLHPSAAALRQGAGTATARGSAGRSA